jgi:hypothetical protein
MDRDRFDQRLRNFASRSLSRRAAIATSVATVAAVATRSTSAQEATPAATPTGNGEKPTFLFVQLAEVGTWLPKPGEDGVFLLSLSGASGQTLFFSDRPDRIVGTVPTDQFFDGLGFTPAGPPNAALVVRTPDGERDVLVIEVFNPVYTENFGEGAGIQLTYEARVLGAYEGEGLTAWSAEQADDLLPAQFTNASLFIDDCPDATSCFAGPQNIGPLTGAPIGTCWNWTLFKCIPCAGDWPDLDTICNNTYDLCNGQCCAAADSGYPCPGAIP